MSQLPIALIPSKTFLFGEYAVLANAPAIVLATPPFFEVNYGSEPTWHELSIANIIKDKAQELSINNKHNIKGLGRSGAECLASWLQTNDFMPDINQLLTKIKNTQLVMSGGDVLCQWHGQCLDYSKQESYEWPFPEIDIGIWSTGFCAANHTYISKDTKVNPMLIEAANLCYKAWNQRNSNELIKSINLYQSQLVNSGLQLLECQRIVKSLAYEPSILAVKGCGTMGADTILTLSEVSHRSQVYKIASNLGQKVVFHGNYVVPGLSAQWQHAQQKINLLRRESNDE